MIPGSYLEPFALPALGWAPNDEESIHQAIARFEAMGMMCFRERDRSVDRSMSNESHPLRWLRQSMGMGPPPHVVPQAMF